MHVRITHVESVTCVAWLINIGDGHVVLSYFIEYSKLIFTIVTGFTTDTVTLTSNEFYMSGHGYLLNNLGLKFLLNIFEIAFKIMLAESQGLSMLGLLLILHVISTLNS